MTLRNAIDFGEFVLILTGGATLAYFNDLGSGKDRAFIRFAFLVWLVWTFGLSTFADHIVNVIEVCAKKQMSGITAKPVVALMKNMQVIWDRSIYQGPSNTVRTLRSSIDRHCSVTMTAYTGLPVPAVIWALFVNSAPKSAFYWLGARVVTANVMCLLAWLFCSLEALTTTASAKFRRVPFTGAAIVSIDVANGLTFHMASTAVCLGGNRRFLPATTQAKAIGIRIGVFCFVCLVLVSKDITKWFVFFPSSSFVGALRNICLLPTSAVAISVRDFLSGLIRGMLAHVDRSFQRLTMPQAAYDSAAALLLALQV